MKWVRAAAAAVALVQTATGEAAASLNGSGSTTNLLPTPSQYEKGTLRWRGINLSGAEWKNGLAYKTLAPVAADVTLFGIAGANAVRYPISWDLLQPHTLAPASTEYLAVVVPEVEALLGAGYSVLLDLHAYMRHNGTVCTAAELADAWSRLLAQPASGTVTFAHAAAAHGGAGNETDGAQLVFDVMNEPNQMDSGAMVANYNAALKAIRGLGFKNLALLEGNSWSGLHAWTTGNPPNADVMRPGSIVDPADHWAVNVHQYLDADSSGTHPECIGSDEFASKVNFEAFARWLADTRQRAFLSEFGAAYNDNCVEQERRLLDLVSNHSVGSAWANNSESVGFIGFTAWSAGHAWGDHYFMGLNRGDQAQAMVTATFGHYWTPPPGACDAPGFLLSFISTPPEMATGYGIQIHNAAWDWKTTLTENSKFKDPAGLVCVNASAVQHGATQIALYDASGTQFICAQEVNVTANVLDLASCRKK